MGSSLTACVCSSLHQSSLLREVAAEGIAKLLMSGRILSQKLVAKLLILWYNPLIQEEDHLRNVLGVFFPAFASSDKYAATCNTLVP